MDASRNSKLSRRFEPLVAFLLLALTSVTALVWFNQRGYTLYYGDAEAHLNVARRILDSRTPGLMQVGTAWLPLPHLAMLPFVQNDGLWRSGVGGAIPSAICFVVAGMFLFAAARRVYGLTAAAATTLALFALNPNLLYLQSAPMTESPFFAALAAMLYFTVRFRDTQSLASAAAAGMAGMAATLTRYEGWFLIPFVAVYFLAASKRRRPLAALVFGVIAALGPLLWLAHNWWYWGDALAFYRGPYSAKGIYERTRSASMPRYPGENNWRQAWFYYCSVVRVIAGWPLVWLGVAGTAVAALFRRTFWPLLLLLLPPVFYVWSLHSGGTPIYMPHLFPYSYYNTRYGLAALPLLALAAGALVAVVPARFRAATGVLAAGLAVLPWLCSPRPDAWVCWKEALVNSEARRAWTKDAATFLRDRYRAGAGVIYPFGDLTGIFREAGIPLRETLYDGNIPYWDAALVRPDYFLKQEWAVALAGDVVANTVAQAEPNGPRYRCVKTITVKEAPAIQIYRRN
jgi:hypothetical protein